MKYIITSYDYSAGETYQEKYDTEKEMLAGLYEMLEREERNLTEEDVQTLITTGYYGDNYDNITLSKVHEKEKFVPLKKAINFNGKRGKEILLVQYAEFPWLVALVINGRAISLNTDMLMQDHNNPNIIFAYDENNNGYDTIQKLQKQGLVQRLDGRKVYSGFCEYYVYELLGEYIREREVGE